MSKARRILAVDDQKDFLDAISHEIRTMGHDVVTAHGGEEGLAVACKDRMDLIISDVRMPGWDGRRLLLELRKVQRTSPPFLFMTGYSDISFSDAFNLGADGFLAKPFVRSNLQGLVQHLLTPLERRFISHDFVPKGASVWRAHPNPAQFQLGRGGFSLSGIGEIVSAKVGDYVDFWIDVPGSAGMSLKGTGVVKWLHDSDEGTSHEAGVAIVCLEERSNQWFSEYVKMQEPLSFIPVLGTKRQGDAK